MANNHSDYLSDAEWKAIGDEACECTIEIYILRKDKVAVLCERELPVPTPYVSALVAALLHLPKAAVTKITLYCDGDKWP